MAGVRIEVGLNNAALRRAIKQAADRAENPKQALELSGAALETSTQARFDSGIGADGVPWPPSRRATEQGGQTLRDSGNLKHSIRWELEGDDAVLVGSDGRDAPYAATHQFGATIRPKRGKFLVFKGADGGLVFAREVTIPARPFLGVDAEDERELLNIWTNFAAEPFK